MTVVCTVQGAVVHVLGGNGGVVLTDNRHGDGMALLDARARELFALLDRALAERDDTMPEGTLIGSVSDATGGHVHVLAFGHHVTVHDSPDPHGHAGWTFRFEDQVIALRDAIHSAVGT